MIWNVQCQVISERDGWTCSHSTPTFNLNPDFVGTNLEHIRMVARHIVDPAGLAKEVHVSAVLV